MCDELYEIDISGIDNDILEGIYDLVSEANKQMFISNTDGGRLRRARMEVKTYPPKISDTDKGEALEYDFKDNIYTTEMRPHAGYVIHNGNDVVEMYCDCKDFFYRLYAPMVKAGYATWDIPPKYQSRIRAHIQPAGHNHEWTNKTNPSGKLFVCKHLAALLLEYVDSNLKVKPLKKKGKEVAAKIAPEKPKSQYQIKKDISKKKEIVRAKKDNAEIPTDLDEPKNKITHLGKDDEQKQDELERELKLKRREEKPKPKPKPVEPEQEPEEIPPEEPEDKEEPEDEEDKPGFFQRMLKKIGFGKKNKNEGFSDYYNNIE